MKHALILFLGLALSVWPGAIAQSHLLGPLYRSSDQLPQTVRLGLVTGPDAVHRWNRIAIDASGLDHTPVAPGEPRTFGEQLGPGRSSRAMAIVHIAMFEALNAVAGEYESYTGVSAPAGPIDLEVAVSQAACDALVALFPSQTRQFTTQLRYELKRPRNRPPVPNRQAVQNGITLGRRAATAILSLRSADGSQHAEPRVGVDHLTSDLPGRWRQDPISLIPLALGAYWNGCEPFVLESASQFRVPPPPALDSAAYALAFDEVKRLGGDGIITPTERTPDQTQAGIYWAYDGTPSLCAPPRLYNQIALQIGEQAGVNTLEMARLLALVNVAMADAGIAIWESKYFHDLWRPVTGIREADPGTGPTGLGDGNPLTLGDVAFHPLGAPASNLTGPNFTPPFPAYPSGHAGFGGALFQILRRYSGTDDIPFTFVSDEYNGITRANDGGIRPLLPRSFATLSEAEEENGQSRIYLGIHWSFDKTEGIAQGRSIADYVFDHLFTPRAP